MVVAVNVLANVLSWRQPRFIQHVYKATVGTVMASLLNPLVPRAEYRREEISPYFWPNGKIPTSDEWKALVEGDFRDYRLKLFGLVENPIELSLEELKANEKKTQITLHNCIQGWSGIAAWGGVAVH